MYGTPVSTRAALCACDRGVGDYLGSRRVDFLTLWYVPLLAFCGRNWLGSLLVDVLFLWFVLLSAVYGRNSNDFGGFQAGM